MDVRERESHERIRAAQHLFQKLIEQRLKELAHIAGTGPLPE